MTSEYITLMCRNNSFNPNCAVKIIVQLIVMAMSKQSTQQSASNPGALGVSGKKYTVVGFKNLLTYSFQYFCVETKQIVRTAIQKVLTDDGFNICSESAVKARETAEKLLEWSSEAENQGEFASFASDLT